jgi:hypothetical protein
VAIDLKTLSWQAKYGLVMVARSTQISGRSRIAVQVRAAYPNTRWTFILFMKSEPDNNINKLIH